MSRLDAALSSVRATAPAPPYQQAATPTPPWLNPGLVTYPPGGPTGSAATAGKPTSSVSLPAIPVAGQLAVIRFKRPGGDGEQPCAVIGGGGDQGVRADPGPRALLLVPRAATGRPAGRRSRWGRAGSPPTLPSGCRDPAGVRRARPGSPPRRRAPHRAWPVTGPRPPGRPRRPRRSLVAPEPGSGRSSRPESTAAANARAVLRQAVGPPPSASEPSACAGVGPLARHAPSAVM